MIRTVLITALAFTVTFAKADDIAWMKDEKAAFAKAKAENQLVMVDIFSNGDQLSKRFNEGTLKFPEVVSRSKGLVPLRSDPAKEGKALAEKYKVLVLPTVLFIAPDGHLVSMLVGYETGEDFADVMSVAEDSFKEFGAVKTQAEKNPKDGEANAKFATFLSATVDPTVRQTPIGAPYLERALATPYKGPYLLRSLEAVGDGYAMIQGKEKLALSYYERAIELSKTPAQKAKAMIGAVYLQMDTNKPAAKVLAQKIVDLKDAPPEWVYEAKVALAELNKG